VKGGGNDDVRKTVLSWVKSVILDKDKWEGFEPDIKESY
jgi:hypothetical protein